MKPLFILLSATAFTAIMGCTSNAHHFDAAQSILVDVTDSMTTALPTTDELSTSLGLNVHPYESVRVDIATISDKDVTSTQTFVLDGESALASNGIVRNERVYAFISKVALYLTTLQTTTTKKHSIVYRQLVNSLNELANADAGTKSMLVYSNLYENADINFYDPEIRQAIKLNPQRVQMQLDATAKMGDLTGITISLLYNSSSYEDNNTFMPIAGFYKQLLEAHGASVRIQNKLSVP